MSIPDHAVWQELENYFKTRISSEERRFIVETIQYAIQQSPEVDLDTLSVEVTQAVLNKRRRLPAKRVY